MIIPPVTWELLFYVFCGMVTIQLFFYLFFFIRLAFHKTSPAAESREQPVSVIVCARDEANNLVKNLPGILVQDYQTTHEIIVVNDNSLDESRYILDEFKKSFKSLNHLELTQEAKFIAGKKFPLSMGIKSAKYETLLLTDADCVPASEHWIRKMQESYGEETEIILGYGAYHKKRGLLNRLIRFETFHSALQYMSFALAGIPYMGVGRNLSYKRDVFMRNKGFSSINHIPSGDDDLFINQVATRRNTAVMADAEAHTLSEPKTTWKEWKRQKARHYTTSKYYRFKHKFWLGLYSATQFMVYPLLAASIVLYNWWMPLAVFGIRFLVQAFIYFRTMKKLNELDLWPWFLFFDIWMFFYYLFFVPSVWRKPSKNWN